MEQTSDRKEHARGSYTLESSFVAQLLFSSTRCRHNDTVNITTHLDMISDWLRSA